jgi:large subunit ribosomal protein L32
MALPKRRKSKAKTRTRRTHNDKVFLAKLVPCSHCGELAKPHHVCPHCGYYNDREVVSQEGE